MLILNPLRRSKLKKLTKKIRNLLPTQKRRSAHLGNLLAKNLLIERREKQLKLRKRLLPLLLLKSQLKRFLLLLKSKKRLLNKKKHQKNLRKNPIAKLVNIKKRTERRKSVNKLLIKLRKLRTKMSMSY